MARRRDNYPDFDHLYQLPPADFVRARNALARQAGGEGAAIRALQKPSLPAWAVNQLYWQRRDTYQQLLDRAADLRATHEAALRGRGADVRSASRAHEQAVEDALKSALALLAEGGHPATDATKQAIATTLRGLPADEPPGRLTRPLQPRGFAMFAGEAPPGRGRVAPAAPRGRPARVSRSAPDRAQIAAARQEAAAAARAIREAEQQVRRAEFDAARAVREADRALAEVTEAEQALQQAQSAHAAAEGAAAAALSTRDAAQAHAARAVEELAAARTREASARRQLDGSG